jgi:small nuclear ribonucleoprotein (snRNP)-like protein
MEEEICGYLKNYIGKKVGVKTQKKEYEGILIDFSKSWQKGIGDLVLEEVYEVYDSQRRYYCKRVIIRGPAISVIILG